MSLLGTSPASGLPSAGTPNRSPSIAAQGEEKGSGIPTFYAHSRQLLLEAEVWETAPKKGDRPWLGDEPLPKDMKNYLSKRLPPPVLGLTPKDFHVFDNGIEQTINWFKEADVPAFDNTNLWWFSPRPNGTWGTFDFGGHFGPSSATYVIGYVPPPIRPGDCHDVKVVVEGRHVEVSRNQYCAVSSSPDSHETDMPRARTVDAKMRAFANSSKQGAIEVSVQSSSFWSSGALRLASEGAQAPDLVPDDYTYVVNVHDSEAPAAVHLAVGFKGLPPSWLFPCYKDDPEVHVLGMV